jgi:hypothetical protein
LFCGFRREWRTFEGCAEGLKAHRSDIRCYIAERKRPQFMRESRLVNEGRHKIQVAGMRWIFEDQKAVC